MLKCNFCGKSTEEVSLIIAGPNVYICDECVDLCVEIIEDVRKTAEVLRFDNLLEMQMSELMG